MNYLKVNESFLLKKIKALNLEQLAQENGFYRRKSRKITVVPLLISFFSVAIEDSFSLRNWALQLSLLINSTVSKQAIWKRFTTYQYQYLQVVLQKVISIETKSFINEIKTTHIFKRFNHIYVQDSSIFSLDDKLVNSYAGNFSRGQVKSLIKIQAVIDLKTQLFSFFEISDYSKNDQRSAQDIVPLVAEGDLIIRDLGYFSIGVFEKIDLCKAFFISKLKPQINIYSQTGLKMNLIQKLRGKRYLDLSILLGEHQLPVRLIAIKVPSHIAEERIRKARNNRDKRLNHNDEYYALLEYNIFITNMKNELISIHEIEILYGLRWRIEVFFKCWKSNFRMAKGLKNISSSEINVQCFILSMLIFIALTHSHLYQYYWWKFYKERNVHLSLFKFTRFLANNLSLLIFENESNQKLIEDVIAYSCKYETRSDRQNYSQLILNLN